MFNQLDTDNSGSLSKDELIAGYRKFYGSDFDQEEVEKLIDMMDSDGNGLISLNEFMLTAVNQEKFLTIQRLESIFSEIDIDKNQRLSLEELNTYLGSSSHLDKEALAHAFAQVDPHGVGEITFQQFQKLIQHILS